MTISKKAQKIVTSTLAVLLAITMFGGMKTEAYASSGISVSYNGKTLAFDQEPIVKNNRTLVPLRAIFEAMGLTVLWNPTTQSVSAYNDEITIGLQIGNNSAVLNSKNYGSIDVFLDVEPQIINGRTLVPVRFIGESSGADVSWISSTNTVVINKTGDRYFGDDSGAIDNVNYIYRGYISKSSGLADGFGSLTYSNNSSFVGTFKNGLQEGQGTFTYYDGSEYVGQFVAGMREGQGTNYYANGDVYIGRFSNDVREGQGTYYWTDGRVSAGIWHNDDFVK